MTIEERTREQEKSQFTKEELEELRNLHGVNSPFGIGYYLGATEQRDIDIEKVRNYLTDNVIGSFMTANDLFELIKIMEE